ncbi:MAG: ceramidase domain-containing protein [Marmoricola sp.]
MRDRRPFALAAATAVVSLVLMFLAARHGWLGPDVGRGADFCEAARSGWLKQPANALSNLGFVVAGLAIGWHAGLASGRLERLGLASAYGVVVVLLGPGSMAMHATQTALGGRLDTTSMYLVAGFAAAYSATRMTERGVGFFGVAFVGAVMLCELVERIPGSLPAVMSWGNVVFGALLVLALSLELRMRRRNGSFVVGDVRWVWGAVASIGVAFTTWNLAKNGTALCHPHSLVQGHAAWHLLCAVSAYCLYRYWASVTSRVEPEIVEDGRRSPSTRRRTSATASPQVPARLLKQDGRAPIVVRDQVRGDCSPPRSE